MSWEVIDRIVFALLLATVFGWLIVEAFLRLLVRISDASRGGWHGTSVPAWVVGVFERLFTMGLVAYEVEGTPTILLAWMAAKLAANWQTLLQRGVDNEFQRIVRARAFIAIMAGVLSLSIGVLAGLIARGDGGEIIAPFAS